MKKQIILGVDTGGTFTDFALYQDQQLTIHKVLSTPTAPEQAILKGIKELGLENQLEQLKIVHGSTVATNALLEHKGVRTVYITNKGLKDVLTIGRQARLDLYDLTPTPIPPPVAQDLCLEIDVRRDFKGQVISALSQDKLEQLAQQVLLLKPEAIAINLLYSYLDPSDERQIADFLARALKDQLDDVFISCSSAVLAEYKEYERGIATWINAWLGPKVYSYLRKLQAAVSPAKVSIMQSSGGTMSPDYAANNAVRMLLSGPAGGIAATKYLAKKKNINNILSFDMGGTSTDVALIEQNEKLTTQSKILHYPIAVPMIDMHTIGAGGGSIAYIDAGGLLQVGPESAGAQPGPACYGLGGKKPTVTDANVVLGRISAEHFLAGKMKLDSQAAIQAINTLARSLKLSIQETAQGIIDIANEHMCRALRMMSVQKGVNPSELCLVSFGGAGALHVCALADALEIHDAIIPANAGVLSAFGMLVAPASRELSQTYQIKLADTAQVEQTEQCRQKLFELEQQGVIELLDEGINKDNIQSRFGLDLRYLGQSYALTIICDKKDILNNDFLNTCVQKFHQQHQQKYAHKHESAVELVTLRVKVFAEQKNIQLLKNQNVSPTSANQANVEHNNDEMPHYLRSEMQMGQAIFGPALILETVSTTFVAKNWSCEVDGDGNLLLKNKNA